MGRVRLFALVLAVLFTSASYASVPTSGTLNAPAAGQTSSTAWSGGPYTGATADPSACTSVTCDTFTLSVNIPSTFYSSNPNYAVQISINWASNTNDFDLYLYDSNGNVVGSSGQSRTTGEQIDAGQLPAGTYRVQVVGFATVNATYSATATLGPEPANAQGKARYKPGSFGFTTPQVLHPAATSLTGQQGIEPRVESDAVGNLYAAAIEGIPAGVDVWKSMDGGKNWTFLGQPDGAQAAAAIAAGGVGAGGGDEDLAIAPNGTVYVNSLWLGSATQSTSTNGGATWVVNPFSSDVPLVDRQWIAADGNSALYLTYKQLGALLSGTETVFVAKSFDGGITWPQITPVTTPSVGIQPGDQGNIVVDKNTHYVYTTFFNESADTVYVARSTDGGKTFTLKQVYTAANGNSLQNVFPVIAVDKAGYLYVTFSDSHNIYITGSRDQGANWTVPVRVSNGAGTKSSLSAWVAAGDAGKVNVMWWGTSAASNMDTTASWQVFFAQTQNLFANVPTFYQSAASPVMHVGAICVDGTGCATGTRNLAEYFAGSTYIDGGAVIVYPDDKNNSNPMTTFIRQSSGPVISVH